MRVSVLFLALAVAAPALCLAATWTVSPFSQSVIMGVSFVDPKTGFIAGGDNGVGANVLKSTDGGQTFNPTNTHPAMMFLAIDAFSADNAVVAGLGLLSGGNQFTTDGMDFTNSSMPKVSMQQAQDVEVITGTDGQSIVVTGQFGFFGVNGSVNALAISNDSGASFTFAPITGSDMNIPARYGSFPSTQMAVVASGTWPPSKHASAATTAISRNMHLHRNGQMHLNRKNQKQSNEAGWVGQIWVSDDGFETFRMTFSNETFYFNEINCPSTMVCYAAAENDDFGFGYVSKDGGNTWTEALAAEGVSMVSAYALSETEAFFGGGILSEAGINGTVYHTTDGGNTFQLTTIPGAYITSMNFLDAEHGFATAMNAEQQCNVLIYA